MSTQEGAKPRIRVKQKLKTATTKEESDDLQQSKSIEYGEKKADCWDVVKIQLFSETKNKNVLDYYRLPARGVWVLHRRNELLTCI